MEMKRVCIYIGERCNMKCRYCMRDNINGQKIQEIDCLSNNMLDFLKSRTLDNNEAVIVTGGEPLIYFEKIKEIFRHLSPEIHKKIITNGTLITQTIVDYCNQHNIEVNVSHDGLVTEYTRGIDVFKDAKQLALIKQLKELTVSYVVTKLNCDIFENYKYIKEQLNRNVFLTLSVIFETGNNQELIDGFDYELFQSSYIKYVTSDSFVIPKYYIKDDRCKVRGINLLMDGRIIDLSTLQTLDCTVESQFAEAVSKIRDIAKECPVKKCYLQKFCCIQDQLKTEHTCKGEQVLIKASNYLANKRSDFK